MKYLVNRDTKEHKVASEQAVEAMTNHPAFNEGWQLVEADSEGWIPCNEEECPIPDDCECEVQTKEGDRLLPRMAKRWTWCRNIGDATITHYRPILSETAEKEEPRRPGRTIAYIPETSATVFDRLKSAIAASESIPAIIAEINALLPEGYCVAKREAEKVEQAAEDMSDWRNWREGDWIEVIENDGISAIKMGDKHKILKTNSLYVYIGTTSGGWLPSHFRFHSRPAKVAK